QTCLPAVRAMARNFPAFAGAVVNHPPGRGTGPPGRPTRRAPARTSAKSLDTVGHSLFVAPQVSQNAGQFTTFRSSGLQCGVCFTNRQDELEIGADTGLAFDPDAALVHFHQVAADRQPQARSHPAALPVAVHLLETLEEPVDLVG